MAAVIRKSSPEALASASVQPPAVVDVARPNAHVPLADTLRRIAQAGAMSPTRLMQDFASLAFGPGKISFADYTRLRLFDQALYAGVDRKAFIGARLNRDIAVGVNYRHDWLGMLSNKVASIGYLAAYGLPVIQPIGIYHEGVASRRACVLSSPEALRDFLVTPGHYPMFGKPTEAVQSLGSASLAGFEPNGNMLRFVDGRMVGIDAFIDDVVRHYAGGYIFQPLTLPHGSTRALCGDRLATIRVLTAVTEDGPVVLRATWKIPAGANVADNFWRRGNLLAGLDRDTGTITRVVSGAGLDLQHVTHHPDTGGALIGARVPNWQDVLTVAVEGARLMCHVPLIGWDMGSTDQGPVIVEMNETPDVGLHQLADGRGMLDPAFNAFVAFQKSAAATRETRMKAELARL